MRKSFRRWSEGSKIEKNVHEDMLLARNELPTNPMNVTTELVKT